MAGIGFELGDDFVQFVWSFNDEVGTQRVATNMHAAHFSPKFTKLDFS